MSINSLGVQAQTTATQVGIATNAVKNSAQDQQQVAKLIEEAVDPTSNSSSAESQPDPSSGRGQNVDLSV